MASFRFKLRARSAVHISVQRAAWSRLMDVSSAIPLTDQMVSNPGCQAEDGERRCYRTTVIGVSWSRARLSRWAMNMVVAPKKGRGEDPSAAERGTFVPALPFEGFRVTTFSMTVK